ncbi:hypothetical protein GLOTRDRAFT_139550 [Gloeophyllum trabeum ATCC 11539]|uniref:Uncharacterized protein n=1 Tax=Gloeophyllum trabeum (strain ATCC 11539 / FP-39264 / Madison 617) TaxID=670483 RepID=S7Q3R1_GLOTA|nr:uncharacterized protein GLOTRDRAFT_139550 [Gloeophyllum trabeum ATCC 11539]EPQ54187.1 hypothetical protein GLOTRDRAFT_139550 [Gloeophyllum trabeum ATCC 11539]
MSAFRVLSKHSRSLSRSLAARSFHTPFVALSESPLTAPPPPTSNVSGIYEKNIEYNSEPTPSANGSYHYVVSQPDPSNTPYAVPSGAYPTSAPYVNYTATERPEVLDQPKSSTSPNPAHPTLSRAVPRNDSGVQESAAVRHENNPNKGTELMDKSSTQGSNNLQERNPPPIQDVGEKFGSMGVKDAWKARN